MHLLILGGTRFLGRALVDAALERRHKLTLFHRGKTALEPPLPQVEEILGDRNTDLERLRGRRWDAVIDTCGYLPRELRASTAALGDEVECYVFVSSVSVYAAPEPGADEHAPLSMPDDHANETIDGDTYGPLKAQCEHIVQAALPGRALIVRPGLIVGPHDPTDRFTYWPARLARGGDVLAPAPADSRVQFVDVRDLAEWIVRLAEARACGVFNAVGPQEPLTMGELLGACARVAGNGARLQWVDEARLLAAGVAPWTELPLWIPRSDPLHAGFQSFDGRKAFSAGLSCRPIEETVRDTLVWAQSRGEGHGWRAGLAPERERALLAACGGDAA